MHSFKNILFFIFLPLIIVIQFAIKSDLRYNQIKHLPSSVYNEPKQQSIDSEMVLIQGGTFQMGSNDGDSDEKPVHSTTISSFYMSKYEITIAQFKSFVDEEMYKTDAEKEDGCYIWFNSTWYKKADINWRYDIEGNLYALTQFNHPVVHVSWNDAVAYCAWLNRKTGKNYRLPTEAEWEYAAGNGNKHTQYSWGNSDPTLSKVGNLADETAKKKFTDWTILEGYTDNYVFTAPVGSFPPNDFGLYDMSGNVGEWCNDWEGKYSNDKATQNPSGPLSGSYRIFRGGTWLHNLSSCRVTDRASYEPTFRRHFLGFRLASSTHQ
jgi:formylglycine-generating enzyme